MEIKEIQAKSILTKSGLPDADWSVNPYVGCQFGCQYCYAAFIGRWKYPDKTWGQFLDVKINAPEVLRQELAKLEKKYKSKNFGAIFFSSVTDCYQAAEAKYQITRGCLQALADFGYQGEISILTKSPLVLRDIELLKKLKAEVGLTITALDDEVSRFFEVAAPTVSGRLRALKKLNDEGVKTYAFVGPVLPHLILSPEKLDELFIKLKEVAVREIYVESINLSAKIKERLYQYLRRTNPALINVFDQMKTPEYRQRLNKIVRVALSRAGLKLIGGEIIYHNKKFNFII
ncbi:radical SAM protein [Patescibacteria group bacterium]|nr:radical SAM protein [Patescibacteria group bacterium]MBU4142779.1 radical SAM protein [Patescibacteria group bacterium]